MKQRFTLSFLLSFLILTTLSSQINTWTGATNNDWFTASNWSLGVPTAAHEVYIQDGTPNPLVRINAPGAVAEMVVIGEPTIAATSTSLTITSSGVLTVVNALATDAVQVKAEDTLNIHLGGVLNITAVSNTALNVDVTSSVLDNDGTINISGGATGLFNMGITINNGPINIMNVGGDGIFNSGSFNNNAPDGILTINTANNGIMNSGGSASFNNFNIIRISNVTTDAIQNFGGATFLNAVCALIDMDDIIQSFAPFNNVGYINDTGAENWSQIGLVNVGIIFKAAGTTGAGGTIVAAQFTLDAGPDMMGNPAVPVTLGGSITPTPTVSGMWTGGAGVFSDATDPMSDYTPDVSEAEDTITLYFELAGCSNIRDSMELIVGAVLGCDNMSCNDLVNISLDATCMRTLTPADVLNNYQAACTGWEVSIAYPSGTNHFTPATKLDYSHRGYKMVYRAINTETGNSCWGYIKVEDKYPPELILRDDTISCFMDLPSLPSPSDGCANVTQVDLLQQVYTAFDCDDRLFVGMHTRLIRSTDLWGNYVQDTHRIYIRRIFLDNLTCPDLTEIDCCEGDPVPDPNSPIGIANDYKLWNPHYVDIDENGYSHPKVIIDENGRSVGLVDAPFVVDGMDTFYIRPTEGHCNIVAKYKDHVIPSCGAAYKIRREWFIKDWCNDTELTCVQWIKILDDDPPVVFYSPDFPPIVATTTKTHECKAHVELKWPTIYNDCVIKSNKTDPEAALASMRVQYELDYPDNTHPGKRIVKTGELKYGQTATVYIPKTGQILGLPHVQVKYTVSDPCWNSTTICQTIMVHDNDPPTPVCDEITQVTLDPQSCWARIYANDLDDGSHDNCDEVHFAIAHMNDIEYWRNYWYTQLGACLDPYEYNHFKGTIHELIEEWIDLYVFDTYLDVTECGTDSVVLRVYENLNTPPYDPHVFRGSEHQWFNWWRAPVLRYGGFRCNYVYYYDSLNQYKKIYPPIQCGDIQLAYVVETIENFLVDLFGALGTFDFDRLNMTIEDAFGADLGLDQVDEFLYFLGSQICETPLDDIFEDGILCFDFESVLENIPVIDLGINVEINVDNGSFMISPQDDMITPPFNPIIGNILAAPATAGATIEVTNVLQLINLLGYLICFEDDTAKKLQIYQNIANNPELASFVSQDRNLVHFFYSGIISKHVLDLPYYNDCMIEVIKDDKTPPVCNAPDDVTYYCDGVPYHWIIPVGVDQVQGWGARYAHDVCYETDVLRSNCDLDKSPAQVWDVKNGGTDKLSKSNGTIAYPARWCVKVPWDGGKHGYYGGPSSDDYHNDCNEKPWGINGFAYDYDWKPIYCRVWLLLDAYDDPSYGKPNPEKYFGTPEYYDNCWYPTIDSTTEGSLNECGVGVLTRTWTVTDKCENQSVCYQRVIIKPRSDFEVIFPADVVADCEEADALSPETTGEPTITDDDCELVGINYVDQKFDIVNGACYKILRTWTIIDWCVYDPDQHFRHPDVIVDDRITAGEDRPCVYRNLKDDGDGYIQYLQVIKVQDYEAPEVTCVLPQIICNYTEDCVPEIVEIDFGSATDNCTPADEIRYRYIIKPEGVTDPAGYLYGHSNKFTGELPFGIHDVYLIAEDRCGNFDTCTTQVAINDCKPPTPYCYNGVATVVMPSSLSIEVWAKDLDAGSFDNCTIKENLTFTFDADGLEQNRVFTCDDIPDGKMEQIEVEIYVWDEAGNVDKCITYILLQDGSGNVCPDQIIAANAGDKVMNVKVDGQRSGEPNQRQSGLQLRNNEIGEIQLYQNRPNPFNSETEISFFVAKAQQVSLRVFDVTGKVIAFTEGNYAKGQHSWNLNNLQLKNSTGLMYYQMKTADRVITKKMIRVE